MKILAFGAHPDDIEFGIAPLLIKEQKQGNICHMAICSLGESGSNGSPQIRKQESKKAATIMGAKVHFLDLGGDGHITYSTKNITTIAKTIRQIQPEIILAPLTTTNQHPDHYHLGNIVRDACRIARYGGFEELKKIPSHQISNLYYYSITTNETKNPDIIINISEEYDQWIKVMECHQSQLKTKNYIDLQTTRSKLLGIKTNSKHAIGLYLNDPIKLEHISDIKKSSRCF